MDKYYSSFNFVEQNTGQEICRRTSNVILLRAGVNCHIRIGNKISHVRRVGNCRYHITPLLSDNLHWLRMRAERITFKLCLLVYKAMNGPAPSYIKELCVPVTTVATRSALRSAARGDLVVPRIRRQLGNRAFSVAGPTAWNSLPPDIRTASTPSTFKNLLKTHLFTLSYNM